MKKMRKSFIETGITLFILVLLNIGNNATIANSVPSGNQLTLTEVFPDQIAVVHPDSILFTVHVTADEQPVPDGLVTIYEETDLSYSVSSNLVDGVVIIEWFTQSWTPTGWCNFIANYEGTTGYDPSSDITQVSISDPVTPGGYETQTSILPSLTTVYPNDTIDFQITITGSPPFLDGYVTLVDITENIVLQRHDMTLSMSSPYIITMSLTVHSWYVNGSHTFEARYTGSFSIDHAASMGSCIIEAITESSNPPSENYTISMTSNATNIDRNNGVLEINATIEGDDPTGRILRLDSIQDNGSIIRLEDEITVTSRNYSYIFQANTSYQIGMIFFNLTLANPITTDIKAFNNISATIYETQTIYNTTMSLNQDIFVTTYGTIQNIPVYISSSSGNTITDGQIHCSILDSNEILLTQVGDIFQGYTNFQVPIEDFGEGSYRVFLEYSGNATQTSTTYNATLNVQKGTAQMQTTISHNNIEYGDTTYWSAHITNNLGNPIANIPVIFETTLTGFYWDHWNTVMTNDTGYASTEVIWLEENQVHYGQPGSYTVRIKIDTNPKVIVQETTDTLEITKNNVILTLKDTTIARFGTAIIDGFLTTSFDVPIPDATISIYSNATAFDYWQKIATVTTDSFGHYFTEFIVNKIPNSYGLRAEYSGNVYYTSDSQNAILNVINNPSEIENIEITPSSFDLGDSVIIKVNATDLDSITSITAIIHDGTKNFSIGLDYVDNVYQNTIWCDNQFQLGTWTIDLLIMDNLGIETTFSSVGQFIILNNPAPDVNYTLNANTIPDGSSFEFKVNASDTLGIASVKIEIESTIYDITQNNITNYAKDQLPSYSSVIQLLSGDVTYTYSTRAREVNVFSFNYTPQTLGNVPFIIYIEDNAGQIRAINGNIMVEAIAPDLSVALMSPLNGTAPFLFSLHLNATDNSGINYIHLYANNRNYSIQYNISDSLWKYSSLFSAGNYIISVIAEDNSGIQKTLDLGTLTISQGNFEIFSVSENLFDGETTNFTIQGTNGLANANVIILGMDNSINMVLDTNAALSGELRFSEPGTYPIKFIVVDRLGTQIEKTITINITTKGPVFESIYPTSSQLATYYTPLTLEVETIVTDASGVKGVILYANDTAYPLNSNMNLWYTTIILNDGDYSLRLVAIDNYGTETVHDLGKVTAQGIIPSTQEPQPSSPSIPTETPQNDMITESTVGIVLLTIITISISGFMAWRKKPKVSIFNSS